MALSGGVDSGVAAYLLQSQGYDLVGVTSLNFPESRCCDMKSVFDAARIAKQLGFPYHTIDVLQSFKEKVIDAFTEGYKQGITPNVCTICNSEVRFEELFEEAAWRYDVDAIASGHYARNRFDPETQRWQLLRGLDPTKDQSYMLYRLRQEQLERCLFPLGAKTKDEVRAIARDIGLEVSRKPDSQDICFAAGDTRKFLEDRIGTQLAPGPIVDVSGKTLGQHQGIAYYTVGQRRGLGIAHPHPLYVVRIDAASNTVVVGPIDAAHDQAATVRDVRWVSIARPSEPLRVSAQVRYRSTAMPAQLVPLDADRVRLEFEEPIFAVTPGQVAAFYQGDLLLGGGVLE
jgi:tRNA-specific 2-thiouridylase